MIKRLRVPIILCAALLAVCCKPTEKEPDGEPRLDSVTVQDDNLVIDSYRSVDVAFDVVQPGAVFNYAVSSTGCQVLLRLEGKTESPNQLSITHVAEGAKKGSYVATLTDNGIAYDYSLRLTIDIKFDDGRVVKSNPFTVLTPNYALQLTSFVFSKNDNPQLAADIVMNIDPGTSTITGRSTGYLPSVDLVARFETNSKVKVAGVEQKSGTTSNNFKKEVIYTVTDGELERHYKVRLTNFTGLPVVVIETPGRQPIVSKEEWVENATIEIDGAGQFDDLKKRTMSIKGRGNTTWGWPKKPYNIKLDSKQPILGMPKNKRWCLIANFMDRTLLRNRIAYYIAGQTSLAWTPRNEYVELILNGKHAGQYLLTEKINVGSNRVDITEMTPDDNSGEAVTGGYLFELDFHFDNVWQWRSASNTPFSVVEPDDDVLTTAQFAWAKAYIAEAEDAVYGSDFADPTRGYAKYIDPQSFIDYWLVYEVTVNHELGNPGSVYLHKDRGGKLVAGPTWDFDWGTFSYNCSPNARYGLFIQWAWWYNRLFQDAAFNKLAKERWAVLKPKFETALGYIDNQSDYIQYSAAENFKQWDPTQDGYINGDEALSWNDAVARMRTILSERISIIDHALR